MLVLKVPVQLVLGEAAVSVPGLDTGVQVCANAGSDRHSDKGASAVAAESQDFRGFAPTLESETRPWSDADLPPFRIIATPFQSARPVSRKSAPGLHQFKLQLSDLRYSPLHTS